MNGLTLKHMRYFHALALHSHFGKAAAACAISQPALSLQIKELESLIGYPLVERGAKTLRLTALGEDFHERIKGILLQVDDLDMVRRRAQSDFTGRLRIGVIPTIAPYLLPKIIQGLSARFPALELLPREAVTQSLLDDLMASRLDFAIMALPVSEPTLQELQLFDEDFLLVRAKADAMAPTPSPKDLLSERLLLLEEGHCFRDQALSFCDPSGAKPRHIMEGSSLSTLVQMVGAGIGITLIPEMALEFETHRAEVCVARFPEPSPKRSIGMVWRRSSPLAPQLKELGALLRDVALKSA